MSKVSLIKNSFNAGELSPKLDGRVDIDKYANGCSILENFIPLVQGPIMKRPGTKFVATTKGNGKVWLARFEFNAQQAFVLEFGSRYIRFYYNGAQVIVGGVPYEVATPWNDSMLTTSEGTFGLSMAQSGDIIYIGHRSTYPRKLSRLSNTNWTLSLVNFEGGPFADQNKDDNINVSFSIPGPIPVGTGFNVTSNVPIFNPNMVGELFQMQVITDAIDQWQQLTDTILNQYVVNDNKYYKAVVVSGDTKTGYIAPIHTKGIRKDGPNVSWEYVGSRTIVVQIVGFVNPEFVNVVAKTPVALSSTNVGWSRAAIGIDYGFPEQVSFFRERLVFARDQKVWFSVAGDYENFAAREFGEVLTDSSISIDITSEDASPIKYLVNTPQGLICGTNSDQVLVTAASISEPFGPNNIRVSPGSGVGSRQIKPTKVDQSILMIHRAGRKLHNTQYDANSDFFIAPDQTVLADHILSSGVVDMVWQREPWAILWMVKGNGQLVGFTFNQQQGVQGFHRHITDGVIEAIQSIPSLDGSRDDLWMVVRRTVNGNTVRYVELLARDYQTGDAQSSAWYSDSALQYNGSPATTISGLNHLIGKTVQILADGANHPPLVVSNTGTVTLQFAASTAIIGLPYTCAMQTMRIEGGANNGTSQGKMKRINRLILRLFNSMGSIQVAPNVTGNHNGKYSTMIFHSTDDRLDLAPPIFTGDYILSLDFQYDRDGKIYIKQTEGYPLTIIAILPDVNTYEQ